MCYDCNMVKNTTEVELHLPFKAGRLKKGKGT